MRRVQVHVLMGAIGGVMLIAATTGLAARQATPGSALRRAMDAETVRGDLGGAIAQYMALADGPDRAVAARALVRLGGIYSRQGDPRALNTFERVVREFRDLGPEVAAARAALDRLGTTSQNGITLRKVMDVGNSESAVSEDGRYLTHNDMGNGTALVLRDLTTGTERTLDTGWTGESTFSGDGTQIAYTASGGIRVVGVPSTGNGTPTPRSVFKTPDRTYTGVLDWSPDGTLLAVYLQRGADNVVQLGLVTVADGTLRVLKTVQWGYAIRAFFSPDGRDLAIDHRGADDANPDVFLLAVDASREVRVTSHPGTDSVLGWTPDGRHLLFGSNRSGPVGVWAQAIVNRNVAGAPVLVKASVGTDVHSIGTTRTGALYLHSRSLTRNVEVATLASGESATASVRAIENSSEHNYLPAWAPDGKSLAYVSDWTTVGIRSLDTGLERRLPFGEKSDRAYGLTWARDGRSFVAWGRDPRNRYGIIRIDAADGSVSQIEVRNPPAVGMEGFGWSPDGTRLYYRGIYSGTILERHLAAETERVVAEGNSRKEEDEEGRTFNRWYGPMSVSPDGRWIVTSRAEAATRSSTLLLVPVGGGEHRTLLRISSPEVWNPYIAAPQWMPDGRAVVALKNVNEKSSELWLVPIDGSSPRKLNVDANRLSRDFEMFRIHPDGKQIAYVAGEDRNEVWALEHFLPVRAAER